MIALKIKKSDFTGLREVYFFTLSRFFKSRSAIISAVILFAFALFAQPVLAYFSGENFGESPSNEAEISYSPIEKIYINDESGLGISTEKFEGEYWENTEVLHGNSAEILGEYDIFVNISQDPLAISVTPAENTLLFSDELSFAAYEIENRFYEALYLSAGITEEQLSVLYSGYSVNSLNESDLAPDETDTVSFGIQYGYSLIVLLLCTYSSGYIIQSVLEEKSSKLVELLMISVKPLALIAGKILAVMTFMFAQIIGLLICMGISRFVTEQIFGDSATSGVLSDFDLELLIGGIGITEAVITVLFLALAYLTVSVISGISGACCNSIEEASSASTASMLPVLSGYIVSMFVSSIPGEALAVTASLVPVLSIFCAPTQYLAGNIDLWVVILALILQAAVVFGLLVFCARVYSSLITHSGTKVKLKELFAIAKNSPKGGETE